MTLIFKHFPSLNEKELLQNMADSWPMVRKSKIRLDHYRELERKDKKKKIIEMCQKDMEDNLK